jgi:hypothetical protein
MERTLLTDGDWATIDGRLCLVTTFVPMAKVQGGSVIAMNATMPYGSVHIKCEELPDDITGLITHKTDFAMLWAAFNARTQVAGVSFNITSPALKLEGLGEQEEVWLAWTKRRYRWIARLFGRILLRLVVMVAPKGAFEIACDRSGRVRPDLHGEARAMAARPLAIWKPEVMK